MREEDDGEVAEEAIVMVMVLTAAAHLHCELLEGVVGEAELPVDERGCGGGHVGDGGLARGGPWLDGVEQ